MWTSLVLCSSCNSPRCYLHRHPHPPSHSHPHLSWYPLIEFSDIQLRCRAYPPPRCWRGAWVDPWALHLRLAFLSSVLCGWQTTQGHGHPCCGPQRTPFIFGVGLAHLIRSLMAPRASVWPASSCPRAHPMFPPCADGALQPFGWSRFTI